MPRIAIIGAGAAGLAAAYRLRGLDAELTVYDKAEHIGGRTLSLGVGGLESNTGALFVYRNTPADRLRAELGIDASPFLPGTWGVHINGETVVTAAPDTLAERLPIAPRAKAELSAFLLEAIQEYRGYSDVEEASELAEERFGTRLAALHPDAASIIRSAVHGGSVADPDLLSAKYALRYFASYLAHDRENRLYTRGGMQQIPEALAAALEPGAVRLGREVVEVSDRGGSEGCELRFADGGVESADRVILAVPAPVVPELVRGLPPEKLDALEQVDMPGSTTFCITADIEGLPAIAEWSFLATVGTRFDAIINPQPWSADSDEPAPSAAQFVCYGNSHGYDPGVEGSEAALQAWEEDFLRVAPELRGRILGRHLQSWEHCFAILTPERTRVIDRLRAPVGAIHFAGDYTSETAGTHGAYAEGERAAAEVRQAR